MVSNEVKKSVNLVCIHIRRCNAVGFFKVNENQIKDSILSRVKYPTNIIYHHSRINEFTMDGVRFHERLMSFCDLGIRNSVNNEPYCFYQ